MSNTVVTYLYTFQKWRHERKILLCNMKVGDTAKKIYRNTARIEYLLKDS